jgi:hypothetical protein
MGTKRVGWARIKSLINENENQLHLLKPKLIALSAGSSRTLTAAESGATFWWTLGSAHHLTLPEATVGLRYTIIIQKGSNANHTIISQSSDKIYGKATLTQHGTADQCNAQIIEKAGSTVDKVHFDGDSTARGGLAGDKCELVCLEAGFWLAIVNCTTSGAPAGTLTILAD